MADLLAPDRGWVVPPRDVMTKARRVQWLRRRASPSRLTESFVASAGRWYGRVARPTGLYVVVVGRTARASRAWLMPCPGYAWARSGAGSICTGGPDSSLGRARCSAPLRLIPPIRDAQPLHGPAASVASLGYHWLDFFLGGWLRSTQDQERPIVVERGWWDIRSIPGRTDRRSPSTRRVRSDGSYHIPTS